jgi:hypothetical protein
MNAVSAPICALLMRMAETDLVFHLPLNARNTARKRPTFLLWPVMEVCWKSADGPRDQLDDASIMRATTPANPALAASLTGKIARSQPLGFPLLMALEARNCAHGSEKLGGQEGS